MRIFTKVLASIAVAGIVGAGGSAFTAAGLTNGAGSTQFVGGQVSQAVTGATLNSVVYGFIAGDATKTQIKSVTLTFNADAVGKAVTALEAGGSWNGDATQFICDVVAAGTFISSCLANTAVPAPSVAGYLTGLTSLTITVT